MCSNIYISTLTYIYIEGLNPVYKYTYIYIIAIHFMHHLVTMHHNQIYFIHISILTKYSDQVQPRPHSQPMSACWMREPLFNLECPEELMKHRLWSKKKRFFKEREETGWNKFFYKVLEWMDHHARGDDVNLSLHTCPNSETCIGQSLVMFFVCLFIAESYL